MFRNTESPITVENFIQFLNDNWKTIATVATSAVVMAASALGFQKYRKRIEAEVEMIKTRYAKDQQNHRQQNHRKSKSKSKSKSTSKSTSKRHRKVKRSNSSSVAKRKQSSKRQK